MQSFEGTRILLHQPKNVQALKHCLRLPKGNSVEHPGTDGEAGILRRTFPPIHSNASATTAGARFVIQYLAIAVAIRANFCSRASSPEQSNAWASRIAKVVAASDSRHNS